MTTTISGTAARPRPVGRAGAARTARGSQARGSQALRIAKWAGEDAPWTPQSLLRLMAMSGLGLIGLGVSWYGMSGEANFHQQVSWLVGGIAALGVAGFGMVGFLLAGLREVHAESFYLTQVVRSERLGQVIEDPDAAESVPAVTAAGPTGWVIGASMTRVHRSDCPHVRGKVVGPISVEDVARLGLGTCGVCSP